MTLEQKVVLVTGGSRGIGRAIALRLADQYSHIAINYQSNQEAAEECLSLLRLKDVEAMSLRANVADPSEVGEMIGQIEKNWGGLDILVNNAGVRYDALSLVLSDDHWNMVIVTNLKGAFNCSRSALKLMLRKRWGKIGRAHV